MKPFPSAVVLFAGALASIASREAAAVTIDTVLVGNAGNAPDVQPIGALGAVGEPFEIAVSEVDNEQYAEFLNAADPTGANLLGLHHPNMTANSHGGIDYDAGAPAGEKYAVKPGRASQPVVFVTWYDAVRFANWLHNGQGTGDTEYGAYTLIGGTPTPVDGASITRNPGALWFLPSEDEWYKAAYHRNDGATGNYWDFPTGSDAPPDSDQPPGSDAPDPSSTANFAADDSLANGYDDGYAVTASPLYLPSENYLTDVGAYPGAPSPHGTFDQGGNAWEWTETLIIGVLGPARVFRGGSWADSVTALSGAARGFNDPSLIEDNQVGFRVARAPEPRAAAAAAAAALACLARRRPLVEGRRTGATRRAAAS